MTLFTESQVLSLASDIYIQKETEILSHEQRWSYISRNDQTLWGEIKGSHFQPYQTQVNTATQTFACTCGSHPHPCKHVLALWLLFLREPSVFPINQTSPSWVSRKLSTQESPKKSTKTTLKDTFSVLGTRIK